MLSGGSYIAAIVSDLKVLVCSGPTRWLIRFEVFQDQLFKNGLLEVHGEGNSVTSMCGNVREQEVKLEKLTTMGDTAYRQNGCGLNTWVIGLKPPGHTSTTWKRLMPCTAYRRLRKISHLLDGVSKLDYFAARTAVTAPKNAALEPCRQALCTSASLVTAASLPSRRNLAKQIGPKGVWYFPQPTVR